MMGFKKWLNEGLEAMADKVFAQRSKNVQISHNKILQALNIKSNSRLKQINQGSFGTIYQHPLDPTKIIKVTGDINDVKNLIKAQSLNSPNVVKIYQRAKLGPRAAAFVADFVKGKSMPYNTNALLALINGNNFDDARTAVRGIFKPDRSRILDKFDLNTNDERAKLSRLFHTLSQLEKLGIDMFDFSDNVLDAGTDYVIVDLGL